MTGSTVFITGAANGIGRAIAIAHAARGDRVHACDINGEGLAALARDVPDIATHMLDVADVDAIEALAGKIWQAGGVDFVYANAGVNGGGAMLKVTPELFQQVFSVNVTGAWATLRAFAARMQAQDRPGRLCATGSEHSLGFQHKGAGVYTASKHAVLGFAEIMRHELPRNISVSVLCPGLTETRFSEGPGMSEEARAFSRAMMAEGLDPSIVARAAIAGVERGDFLITTHAASKLGADVRMQDVEAAFANVPPEGADIERYSVPAAMARVREKFSLN